MIKKNKLQKLPSQNFTFIIFQPFSKDRDPTPDLEKNTMFLNLVKV